MWNGCECATCKQWMLFNIADFIILPNRMFFFTIVFSKFDSIRFHFSFWLTAVLHRHAAAFFLQLAWSNGYTSHFANNLIFERNGQHCMLNEILLISFTFYIALFGLKYSHSIRSCYNKMNLCRIRLYWELKKNSMLFLPKNIEKQFSWIS